MDRNWMSCMRTSVDYLNGVDEFLKCAEQHMIKKEKSMISCPCVNCNNFRWWNLDVVKEHLILFGFNPNYKIWTWHGEIVSQCSSGPSTSVPLHNNVSDDVVVDENEFEDNDRIEDMLRDVQEDFEERPPLFYNLERDNNIPLYNGCSKYTKLSAVFKLLNVKAKFGISDKCFTTILETFADMLPEGNECPTSTYEAKKLLCPLNLKYERIHACPNDCILYRGEFEAAHKCPTCDTWCYKRKDEVGGAPAKVLWYLPIIPRLRRMFSNPDDAKLLRWHHDERKNDGKLRHPADSPQWRNIDAFYPEFGTEVRNLRLGLCTDGINPHGDMSSRHSTWPVLLCIYNLPPWLTMKRKYIMLSLLISGPKQPGNDIDVYLAPLIEDLKTLWDEGVEMYDAHLKSRFTLRGMIFCTINDFPAYGNLSGYSVKGKKACPICGDNTDSQWLNNCRKHVYMGHRKFLTRTHEFRSKKKFLPLFNGKSENSRAPYPLNGSEVNNIVRGIDVQFGKKSKQQTDSVWKKRSIFWDLPYWEKLEVRHCIDVMHVEKNVCDSIVGTLLNMPGKSKDGLKSRQDLVELGMRTELAPIEKGKKTFLPPACYTLSRQEKLSFCECLKGIKVPHGYASNINRYVSMKDLKLVGYKSHDCHALMQHLLPIAIRGIMPKHVRQVISKMCFFFNAICSKVLDPELLDELQVDVVITLCRFEMFFPPSFFDIMVHLVVHLVREIKWCGPAYMRYMYPFERYMKILKGYVRNRYRPEGSIVEGYTTEECVEFCSGYLANVKEIGVPKSRHHGRIGGKPLTKTQRRTFSRELFDSAQFCVLRHIPEVRPFLEEHLGSLRRENPNKGELWLIKEHNRSFLTWFRERTLPKENGVDCSEMIKWLAWGPEWNVATYEGYDINGYTFYTKRRDDKSTTQNSGVTLVALSREISQGKDTRVTSNQSSYYGYIEDIWELAYRNGVKFVLLRCMWVDNKRGVQLDPELGFTLVDLDRVAYLDDPFILASHAKQVFYVKDPIASGWHIVLQGKRNVVGIRDVDDEEDYDNNDDTFPFPTGVENVPIIEDERMASRYVISNHNEGLYV